MTEQTRKYIIIGGIGVGAVVILVAVAGSKNSVNATAQPAAPGPDNPLPIQIPNYPAASFAPSPITIVEAPTFNAPGQRPSFFPGPIPNGGDHCKCNDGCNVADYPPLTLDVFASTRAKLATVTQRSVAARPI